MVTRRARIAGGYARFGSYASQCSRLLANLCADHTICAYGDVAQVSAERLPGLRTMGFRQPADAVRTESESALERAKVLSIPAVFEQLAADRVARVDPADAPILENCGVAVHGDIAVLEGNVELLRADRIRDQLGERTRAWLKRLCVLAHIDSTNSALMRSGSERDIDGEVLMAEVQTAGRGRRGRKWISPFGRNLAMSLGVRIDRPLREIGAVGLAVGLGVADALTAAGVRGASLKWPNDVLLGTRKLCGILIELPAAQEPPCVVIGIGINVGGMSAVAPLVDQAVADVTEQLPEASRNRLAGMVVDAVYNGCKRFERYGFARMKPAYDSLHRFNGESVRLVAGKEEVTGTVAGVGLDGALQLQTRAGLRNFISGEVSLRT